MFNDEVKQESSWLDLGPGDVPPLGFAEDWLGKEQAGFFAGRTVEQGFVRLSQQLHVFLVILPTHQMQQF